MVAQFEFGFCPCKICAHPGLCGRVCLRHESMPAASCVKSESARDAIDSLQHRKPRAPGLATRAASARAAGAAHSPAARRRRTPGRRLAGPGCPASRTAEAGRRAAPAGRRRGRPTRIRARPRQRAAPPGPTGAFWVLRQWSNAFEAQMMAGDSSPGRTQTVRKRATTGWRGSASRWFQSGE